MATDVTYGRHGKYVTMRSSYFANFERSCCERRAKLLRTSSEVAANVEQSCCKHRAKLLRTSSEVAANFERSRNVLGAKLRRPCIAKELHAFRTGAYIALEVEKIKSILWRICDVKVQRVQTTEGCSLWHDGFKAPTIAKILAKENLPATRQGIQKFLKKYTECGSIGRKEGSGRKSKLTAEVRRLVDETDGR